jgi:hypothetical protein
MLKKTGKNIFLGLKDIKRVLKVTKKGLKMTKLDKLNKSKGNKRGAQYPKSAQKGNGKY